MSIVKLYKIDVNYLDRSWGMWIVEAENIWAAMNVFREDVRDSENVKEIQVKEWKSK